MCVFIPCMYYYGRHIERIASTIASCIISPVLRAQHMLLYPIKQYYHLSCQEHAATIKSLEQVCDQLKSELVELYSTYDFAKDTQELVQYKKRYRTDTYLLTQIIYRQCNDNEQYVLIDKGSAHGVLPDMVAVYKNVLIGRVIECYPYYSKVVLITDPRCKVAVYCARTKATGIAEGTCDISRFVVTHVSHLDTVQEGDYIISSGSGLVFPKGFGLGVIEHFVHDGLFYTIYAKPFIALDHVEYCYLMQKGTES